jgi:hypothetical protein
VAVLAYAARSLQLVRDRFVASRQDLIERAHTQVAQLLRDELHDLGADSVVEVVAAPLASIHRTTAAILELLHKELQDESVPGESIHFEVCFMATSYIDEMLTILSYSNTDGRRPRSLTLRAATPTIYDRTEAADLYREAAQRRPEPRLIPDTTNAPYQQLYERERERIASTVVCPVLSASSGILGVLVVSANRRGLFQAQDQSLWFSLFGLYADRVAIDKARLDYAVAQGSCPAPG